MIRSFKVQAASKNPLHFGRRDKVVQFNFKDGTVAFTSYKPGHEKVKPFRCTSFTVMEKQGETQLSVKFDHDSGTYSKTIYFDGAEARDHFCQLMQCICYSNGRAHRLFSELDEGNRGFLEPHLVELALDELRDVSMSAIDWTQKMKERLTRKSAFANNATVSVESGVSPEQFLLAFVKTARDDDFSSGDNVIKNDFAEQKAAPVAVTPTLKAPMVPSTPGGTRPMSPTSALQAFDPDEESGDGSVDELTTLELLEGEHEMLTQEHTSQILNTISSRGSLTLTTFRLVFSEYRSGERWDTSLGNIARIEREEALITVWCKDFRTIRFMFDAAVSWVDGLVKQVQRMAFPEKQTNTFAFSYQPQYSQALQMESNGWNFYDPYKEYERKGFAPDDKDFRACQLNAAYEFSPTYPRVFMVPTSITDDDLRDVAKYRSKARIPAVVYRHPQTHAVMARCSQPMTGIRGKRCAEDEKLIARIRELNPTNSKVLYLVDARPYKAAVGNTVMGKGYESATNYKSTSLQFLNIDNIHVMRTSLAKLVELCNDTGPIDDVTWHSKLAGTQWLYYVRLILQSAVRMVKMLVEEGASVVCHCSDGWDRTSQLCSLVLLMVDPYYRTRRGFAILIEEEWLSFGHRFAERYGQADGNYANDQRAPIFHQFVDCVYQILRQFPQHFEFTEEYLLEMVDAVHSCQFGTFLFNSESERHENNVSMKSISLWTYLCHENYAHMFSNPCFRTKRKYLFPDTSPKKVVVWDRLYLRWDQTSRVRETDSQGRIALYKRYSALRKAISDAGLDISKFELPLPADEDAKRPSTLSLGKESINFRRQAAAGGTRLATSSSLVVDTDADPAPQSPAVHHSSSSNTQDVDGSSSIVVQNGRAVMAPAKRVPTSMSPIAQLAAAQAPPGPAVTPASSSHSHHPTPSTPTAPTSATASIFSKPKAHGRTNSGGARLVSPDRERAVSPTPAGGATISGTTLLDRIDGTKSPKRQPASASKTFTPGAAATATSDLGFAVSGDRTSRVGDSDASMAQARAELAREMGTAKSRSERQGSASAPQSETVAQLSASAEKEPDYKICGCGARNASVTAKFCSTCGTNIEKLAVISGKPSVTPRTGLTRK